MNNSELTPKQAIRTLEDMASSHGHVIYLELADVIRELVQQAESNVKMHSDMLAAPENQDPE